MIHRTVAPFRGIARPGARLPGRAGLAGAATTPDAAFRSRDKLLTTLDLAGAGIPVVPTAAIDEPGGANLAALGPGELDVKPARGVRGEGIATYHSAAALTAAWQPREPWRPGAARPGYHAEREHYLVQPLIGGGGQDIRAYVVGEQGVALMRRMARPGKIRANLALGATRAALPLSHAAAAVAAAALAACGLDFGGVDLIEDGDGAIRVLEVDAWAAGRITRSPGLTSPGPSWTTRPPGTGRRRGMTLAVVPEPARHQRAGQPHRRRRPLGVPVRTVGLPSLRASIAPLGEVTVTDEAGPVAATSLAPFLLFGFPAAVTALRVRRAPRGLRTRWTAC